MRTPPKNTICRCHAVWVVMVLFACWTILPCVVLAKTPAGVAATVNGEAITMEALGDALRLAKVFSAAEVSEVALRVETLRNLMRRTAAVQEATRLGYGASMGEVAARIAFLQERFESREQFQSALEQNGISGEAVQRLVARDILVFKLIQDAVAPQIIVTDDDARYYYDSNPQYFSIPEKVRVRQILLKAPEGAGSEARNEIRGRLLRIKDLLNSGADFSSVAMANSEDTSAENGGDIGFFARDDVAKSFADAAFALAPGAISDVVSTPLGYHLIQQIEKTPESVEPFEDIRLPLMRYLRRLSTALSTKVYLDRLLSASEVKQFVK